MAESASLGIIHGFQPYVAWDLELLLHCGKHFTQVFGTGSVGDDVTGTKSGMFMGFNGLRATVTELVELVRFYNPFWGAGWSYLLASSSEQTSRTSDMAKTIRTLL